MTSALNGVESTFGTPGREVFSGVGALSRLYRRLGLSNGSRWFNWLLRRCSFQVTVWDYPDRQRTVLVRWVQRGSACHTRGAAFATTPLKFALLITRQMAAGKRESAVLVCLLAGDRSFRCRAHLTARSFFKVVFKRSNRC